jgi:hypothetical protein
LKEFKIDKDFKYFEITAKELELLENPSFKSQLDEKKKFSLTENKIRKLIESIDLKFKSFEIMNHNNGIVNGIYLIKVEENQFGLPVFKIPNKGTISLIHDGTNRRAWISIQLIVILSAVILALPAGRRRKEVPLEELT